MEMGQSMRKLLEILRFFLVFFTCVLFCYVLLSFLTKHFLPLDPYHEPHGNAVKVVNEKRSQEWNWYWERLKLFYLVDE
jgi:hypothetical protein